MTEQHSNGEGAQPKAQLSRAARMDRPPEAATGDIDRLFDRLRTLAPPTKVDQGWAKSFSLTDAVKVLTWLGLVRDGKPTDPALWNRVRLLASRQDALGELVRESYKAIFNQIDVAEATREDIEGAFVNQYNLGDTSRYIRAFGALCRHAGIAVPALEPRHAPAAPDAAASASGGRPTNPPTQSRPANTGGRPSARPPETAPAPVLTASIEIPADWTEEQIKERLALVKRLIANDDK